MIQYRNLPTGCWYIVRRLSNPREITFFGFANSRAEAEAIARKAFSTMGTA